MQTTPADLSLREQAMAIASGALSIRALTEAVVSRIASRDVSIGSVVHLDHEAALREAARLDSLPAEDRPPLAGLAFGVKDIIDVAGRPTRCGSHAQEPAWAPRDADAVAALRRAGMIPLAKLATYEFALTGPAWDQPNAPARNPWNREHITGGSSSGAAAAVAAGLMRAALATDTGGSIRAPAAYCGVVGLKPTNGLIPAQGVFPLSPTLDCVGPIAASVAEAALVFDALRPDQPPVSAGIGRALDGLCIGYARDWFADDPATDQALLSAMDDAAGALSMLGARIELVHLPDYAPCEVAGAVILQSEALDVHAAGLAARYDRYGIDARRNLMTGAVLSDEDVAAAYGFAARLRREVDAALAPFAALLAPTTLGPAPAFTVFEDGPVWTAMRTLPFNLTGHPALSVPCGFSGGLPLGMQLIGRHGGEASLCRIGHAFEQATDHAARPAIGAEPVSFDDQA